MLAYEFPKMFSLLKLLKQGLEDKALGHRTETVLG
jgi:hypothetical protein